MGFAFCRVSRKEMVQLPCQSPSDIQPAIPPAQYDSSPPRGTWFTMPGGYTQQQRHCMTSRVFPRSHRAALTLEMLAVDTVGLFEIPDPLDLPRVAWLHQTCLQKCHPTEGEATCTLG